MDEKLCLKYRPKDFISVLGQNATISSLINLIEKRSNNVLIFHGPSGCSKTTLSRIVAKHLGCKEENILEIDGAVQTGVDEMREIISTVEFNTLSGGSKAYIIDECDKLSSAAFLSLKKVMEESDKGICWFLLTTILNKIPNEIKTRASIYKINPVSINDIYGLLEGIAGLENFVNPDLQDIISLISENCNGSPRLAINLLAQCSSLSYSEANSVILGLSIEGQKEIGDLCRALAEGTYWDNAIEIINKIENINAESVKRVILAYFEKVALNEKGKKLERALQILDVFNKPFDYNAKCYPLLLCLAELLLTGK